MMNRRSVRGWFVLLVMTMVPAALTAQEGGSRELMGNLVPEPGNASPLAQRMLPETAAEAAWALDVPVDPASYVLGPGDVLGINLRGAAGWYHQTAVSPDGSLLVPSLPMLQVGGMTLAEARRMIARAWGGEGPDTPVDVALVSVRRVRVSVGGEVKRPGQYIATPLDRASVLVDLAGGLRLETASMRRAWLEHADGGRTRLDLLRYRRSGALDANPRVTGGDHLMVERKRDKGPSFDVAGGVRMPGRFEYLPGDSLLDAVQLAGGLQENAVAESVVVLRRGEDGTERRVVHDLARSLRAGDRGLALAPGDLVSVPVSHLAAPRPAVRLVGEVRRPGSYPVEPGVTTLRDVIERAGGYTDQAWTQGVRVWRGMDYDSPVSREFRQLDSLVQQTNLTDFELDFRIFGRRIQGSHPLPVDVAALYQGAAGEEDDTMVLVDDLVIEVPRPVNTVLVLGQVKRPGVYRHEEGLDFEDYVERAGGYTEIAYKGRVRMVGYASPLWTEPESGERVGAGSMIYVPEEPAGMDWSIFRDVVSIVISTGTLLLLVVREVQ